MLYPNTEQYIELTTALLHPKGTQNSDFHVQKNCNANYMKKQFIVINIKNLFWTNKNYPQLIENKENKCGKLKK